MPFGVGRVDQVRAVKVQDVEQERGQGNRRPGLGRGAGGRVLERERPPVWPQRDQFPVEHGAADR